MLNTHTGGLPEEAKLNPSFYFSPPPSYSYFSLVPFIPPKTKI